MWVTSEFGGGGGGGVGGGGGGGGGGTRRGEGSASRPGRFLPPGKTRYPLYRRLGGPQGRSGLLRKISPPPEFDPRTVQPVASRYAD
jgi:hypothetical protein